jgi:hypothetical protein
VLVIVVGDGLAEPCGSGVGGVEPEERSAQAGARYPLVTEVLSDQLRR